MGIRSVTKPEVKYMAVRLQQVTWKAKGARVLIKSVQGEGLGAKPADLTGKPIDLDTVDETTRGILEELANNEGPKSGTWVDVSWKGDVLQLRKNAKMNK